MRRRAIAWRRASTGPQEGILTQEEFAAEKKKLLGI
jgi:hypothetical protein